MQFYTDADLNGTFVANYTLNTSVSAPTEVFFNEEVYYTNGYQLSVVINDSPVDGIEIYTTQKNYIRIYTNRTEYNGKTVSIVLSRKTQQESFDLTSNDKSIKVNIELE